MKIIYKLDMCLNGNTTTEIFDNYKDIERYLENKVKQKLDSINIGTLILCNTCCKYFDKKDIQIVKEDCGTVFGYCDYCAFFAHGLNKYKYLKESEEDND